MCNPNRIRVIFGLILLSFLAATPLQSQSPTSGGGVVGRGPGLVLTKFDKLQPAPFPDRQRVGFGASLWETTFLSGNQNPEGDMPREVEFLPGGSSCVIANRETDTVTFFDVNTRTITDTVATGDAPVDIAVAPDGSAAVVPNLLGDSITIIDLATRTARGTVSITGTQPYHVAITADSAFAVVGVINDAVSSSISVVNLTTQQEVRTFSTVPQGIIYSFSEPTPVISGNVYTQFAVSSDNRTVVVPDRHGSQVALYDFTTGAQRDLISTASLPAAVDVSADGTVAVVCHEGRSILTKIDISTASLITSFDLGSEVRFMDQTVKITPNGSSAVALAEGLVVIIDLSTGSFECCVRSGHADVGISFDGQFAFVSGFGVQVIDIAAKAPVAFIGSDSTFEVAASPTELRAVSLNNRLREDIHLYNINGSQSFFEGKALTGELEEGDAIRRVRISADGRVAVASGRTSDNAVIFDLESMVARSYVSTGDLPDEVAVSNDGTTAVVLNVLSKDVTVIDLTTDTPVATVQLPDFPIQVAISPDGSLAYVAADQGLADSLHVIRLSGSTSTLLESVPVGNFSFFVVETPGIVFSPDASIIALCMVTDEVVFVDSATHTVIARIPLDRFPFRVKFLPDGSRAYVGHAVLGDTISVIDVGSATVIDTIANVGGRAFDLDEEGRYLYSAHVTRLGNPRIRVVDTTTNSIIHTFSTVGIPQALVVSKPDDIVYMTTKDATVVVASGEGPSSQVLDTIPLSEVSSDLAFSHQAHTLLLAQPGPDGIDCIRLAGEYDCRRGNLNATSGFTADVVFVNGSPGSPAHRTVTFGPNDPLTINVQAAPSRGAGRSKFALYAWIGSPDPTTLRELPFGLGTSCMVMPPNSDSGRPQDDPKKIWNNIARAGSLGVPNLPSTPAPVQLVNNANGAGRTITAFLQGVMLDSAAPQGQAGVTNGVRIVIE